MADDAVDLDGTRGSLSLDEARSILKEIMTISDQEPDSRSLLMVRRYALGASLDAVGASFHVSRERVRQIINETAWPMHVLRKVRSVIEADEKEARARAAKRLILQWSADHSGEPIENAVKELGMPMTVISRALGSRRVMHRPAVEKKRRAQRWPDDELIALIQEFHAQTGSTVSKEFEDWSLARGGPTRQTPINRFGKWYHALEAAGISASSYSVKRERRYTEDDLWAAVIEFFRTERAVYSFNAFSDWLAEVPERPSGSLVRVRLGRDWSELSRIAQELIAGAADGFEPGWVQDVLTPRDWASLVPEKADPVEILREAVGQVGPVVTMVRYSKWAAEHDAPPANTLIQRAGMTWSALVGAAGGRVGTRGRRGRISDDELLEPLVIYLQEGGPVSYEQYSQWARTNKRPVAGTVAERFNGWESAVRRARSVIEAGAFTEESTTMGDDPDRAAEMFEAPGLEETG